MTLEKWIKGALEENEQCSVCTAQFAKNILEALRILEGALRWNCLCRRTEKCSCCQAMKLAAKEVGADRL